MINDLSSIQITPISHATMVINVREVVIYVDPVGGIGAFSGQEEPDLILITDVHSDHMDVETLGGISKEKTVIVMCRAVANELPNNVPGKKLVLLNNEETVQKGIKIKAVPMYNIPESDNAYHTKGRGNGYILDADGNRIYIAGDTGNIPEMKELKNIDIAFIPMNLPYTMTEEEAANAVLSFKPKVVHPYHYRGAKGFSDINKFKKLVEERSPDIKVEILNFYP